MILERTSSACILMRSGKKLSRDGLQCSTQDRCSTQDSPPGRISDVPFFDKALPPQRTGALIFEAQSFLDHSKV